MEIRSILLAEDDPHIRRVSEIALRRDGFGHAVSDGAEVLQLLEDRLFDLVVLDGMMPNMDGLEACRRIKTDPRTQHISVVMLNARTQASDEAASQAAGALGYIRKPFDALQLGPSCAGCARGPERARRADVSHVRPAQANVDVGG